MSMGMAMFARRNEGLDFPDQSIDWNAIWALVACRYIIVVPWIGNLDHKATVSHH